MYKKHLKLIEPKNPNEKIWRYMDFTKYVSLLSKQALFFCRVDKLGDQNEMTLPIPNKNKNVEFYNKNKETIDKKFNGALTLELWNKVFDFTKHSIIINSWSRSIYESAALWHIYTGNNHGIAIQTTFKRLCDSFQNTPENINIGIVNYKDYKKDLISNETIYGLVSHKLKSYSFENELRAIITNQVDKNNMPLHRIGKYVNVDLNILIESIYISPNTPEWLYELVVAIRDKFSFDFPIKKSELNDKILS